ncbi:MAG: V-type ATP synthase subunit E [Desulfurococcales archaeon]|nr:V-type ATP synthase subunit E [Desulfurococcales archaeon]
MPGFHGDPARLAEEAVSREREEALSELQDAYETALRLLEAKLEEVTRKSLQRLRDEYMIAEERVKSARARAEIELKTFTSAEREKFIDEVIEEARERLRREKVGASWYRAFMERVFDSLAEEAAEYGELVVRVAPEDLDLARSLAQARRGLRVSGEPADILGGAIAATPEGSATLDYSLDLLLRDMEPLLRSVASRAMFGSTR